MSLEHVVIERRTRLRTTVHGIYTVDEEDQPFLCMSGGHDFSLIISGRVAEPGSIDLASDSQVEVDCSFMDTDEPPWTALWVHRITWLDGPNAGVSSTYGSQATS